MFHGENIEIYTRDIYRATSKLIFLTDSLEKIMKMQILRENVTH